LRPREKPGWIELQADLFTLSISLFEGGVTMEVYFKEYVRILETLIEGFRDALHQLPQDGMDWAPGPEMNSIAVLAVHTAGALRYWLGDVALGEPSGRDRAAEFRTQGIAAAEALNRLEASLDYAREGLAGLAHSDLDASRVSPRDGRQVTCGWALLHALEHTAQHAAHAQLTRQLWQQAQQPRQR
jgi:hypothetical protein